MPAHSRLQFRSLFRMLLLVLVELLLPGPLEGVSALTDPGGKMRYHFTGDQELLVFGPAHGRFGQTHLLFTQR